MIYNKKMYSGDKLNNGMTEVAERYLNFQDIGKNLFWVCFT